MNQNQINSVNAKLNKLSSALAAFNRVSANSAKTAFMGNNLTCFCAEIYRSIDLSSDEACFELEMLIRDVYAITPISAAV